MKPQAIAKKFGISSNTLKKYIEHPDEDNGYIAT